MNNPLNIKGGPAIWVGIIASAILAAFSSLAGNGVISTDLVATLVQAFDPTQGGWALPFVIGIVTRFFVSPADRVGWS